MHIKNIFILFILLSTTVIAQKDFTTREYLDDPAWTPREHNVDFKHLLLNISFKPEEKK